MFNFNKNKYEKYNSLINYRVNLSLLDDEVPQGICVIDNHILVSCYSTSNKNSRVVIYEDRKRYKTIYLNNKAHVGGICYDNYHNLIFITDSKGYVCSYNFTEFLKGDLSSKRKYLVSDSKVGGSLLCENNNLVTSFINYYKGKIYVGSFRKRKKGLIKVFDIVRGNDINLKYSYEFLIPSIVQGVCFYKYKNITYMFLSRSYGRRNSSKLEVYNYSSMTLINKFILPPMLEEITVSNDRLLLVYESGSSKYRNDCNYIVEDIISIDVKKLI